MTHWHCSLPSGRQLGDTRLIWICRRPLALYSRGMCIWLRDCVPYKKMVYALIALAPLATSQRGFYAELAAVGHCCFGSLNVR